MYKLVISDDKGHATVVPLLRDEITIGRQEGNSIRLTERNVSRSHARLLRRNGSYIVEDLGSYNGITVNGERIDAKAELAAGAVTTTSRFNRKSSRQPTRYLRRNPRVSRRRGWSFSVGPRPGRSSP